MQNKKNKMVGLGRGLGALLQDNDALIAPRPKVEKHGSTPHGGMTEVPLTQIDVNPFQPRTKFDEDALRELAESIKVQGIIQPITIRQHENGRYQLISGERRLQASRLLGLGSIPAYIRTANDQQMLEMALIENIQRENLNAIEIGLSYQRLIQDCQLRQDELGARVGKNRTTVNNYMRLLKLPAVIQAALRDNLISMGHARAIITVDNSEKQLRLFKRIMEEGWSVRKIEEEVRKLSLAPKALPKTSSATENNMFLGLQERLSNHLGSKVLVKNREQGKGEIRIAYETEQDLSRILDTLNLPD